MKFFQRQDYYEGEGYPENVILSWGTKYDSGFKQEVVNPELQMVASERAWIKNGFYVKVELPFTFTTTYIDPTSFTYKIGKVRPTAMFARRKSQGKAVQWLVKVLKPLNPTTDPLDVKKNLEKFGPELSYSNYIGEDTAPPVFFVDAANTRTVTK